VANTWSPFSGLPVAWGICFGLEYATLAVYGLLADCGVFALPRLRPHWLRLVILVVTAPWSFGDAVGGEIAVWGAILLLMLPAYLVSYLGEASVLRKRWPLLDPKWVSRHVWLAHLVTDALLSFVAIHQFWMAAYR
jgi:hypothetical protein